MLVTLGGCHLLDGLLARGSVVAYMEIVRYSGEVTLLEVLYSPYERSQRATLVETRCEKDLGDMLAYT